MLSDQGDLSKPETIPATLVGIHTVIDCATGRPEEPIRTVLFAIFSIILSIISKNIEKELAHMVSFICLHMHASHRT